MIVFSCAVRCLAARGVALQRAIRAGVAAVAVVILLPGTALAASYAYDFELTLLSEQVRVSPQADNRGAPRVAQSEWVDLSLFGPDAGPFGLGIGVGETIRGALHLTGPDDFGLSLRGSTQPIDFAFVTSQDPTTGDVALAFSTTSRQYDFDFIDDDGTLRTDNLGEIVAADGSVFFYAGYTAEFALVPLGGSSQPLAAVPLPAGPMLLLAALGGLAALKSRRRVRAE